MEKPDLRDTIGIITAICALILVFFGARYVVGEVNTMEENDFQKEQAQEIVEEKLDGEDFFLDLGSHRLQGVDEGLHTLRTEEGEKDIKFGVTDDGEVYIDFIFSR